MRIPFQIPAKGMEDTNEAGSKTFRFIIFMKQASDDAVDRRKQAV